MCFLEYIWKAKTTVRNGDDLKAGIEFKATMNI
jgi:hypothetical protein